MIKSERDAEQRTSYQPSLAALRSADETLRQNAWGTWFTHDNANFLKFARQLTRNQMQAEDVLQQSWMKLMTKVANPDTRLDKKNMRGYMMITIRNTFLDTLRRQEASDPSDEMMPERASASVEDEVIRQSVIEESLSRVPTEYRRILFLKINGYTGPDIAQATGLPEGTVRSQLHRAQKILRTEASKGTVFEK